MFNRKQKGTGRCNCGLVLTAMGALLMLHRMEAAEAPNFITYTHQMEEPGNLEIDTKSIVGKPPDGRRFLASAVEFEYGATAWWTTEFYLDGQTTAADSTLLTGFRWENRFHVLPREHWINPVLYVEFEDPTAADKTLLEVVGNDGKDDFVGPNSETRREKARELETKLILGSHVKGWTIAENVIAEKNLRAESWEFGYAVAVSRPFALRAKPERCTFCAENFQAGFELYGGLGTRSDFGLRNTSQYVGPTIGWQMPNGPLLRLSPTAGLTGQSLPFLIRFSVSYEVAQAGRAFREMLAGGKGGRR